MTEKPMDCEWCSAGSEPRLLDINGVLCNISANPGCWSHSFDDGWRWRFCLRKAAEEHAIIEKLPKNADGDPVYPGLAQYVVEGSARLSVVVEEVSENTALIEWPSGGTERVDLAELTSSPNGIVL